MAYPGHDLTVSDARPLQEISRDQWSQIKPGGRVRVEYHDGTCITGTSGLVVGGKWLDVGTVHCVNLFDDVARVYLLAEPVDPDADLIEHLVETLQGMAVGDNPSVRDYARAVLAVVRESEATR